MTITIRMSDSEGEELEIARIELELKQTELKLQLNSIDRKRYEKRRLKRHKIDHAVPSPFVVLPPAPSFRQTDRVMLGHEEPRVWSPPTIGVQGQSRSSSRSYCASVPLLPVLVPVAPPLAVAAVPDRIVCPVIRYRILRHGSPTAHQGGGERFYTRAVPMTLCAGDSLPSHADIRKAADLWAESSSAIDSYSADGITFEYDSIVNDGVVSRLTGIASLSDLQMHGDLRYLGDEDVEKLTGDCGVNGLLARIRSCDKDKVAENLRSPSRMIEWLQANVVCNGQPWKISDGLSARQMVQWAQSEYVAGRVSLYFIGPDDHIFSSHVGRPERGRARVCVCFPPLASTMGLEYPACVYTPPLRSGADVIPRDPKENSRVGVEKCL